MTRLERVVRRVVSRGPGVSRRDRDLVLELIPATDAQPAALLVIRELRTRKGYGIGIAALYVMLARRAAEQGRTLRRGRRSRLTRGAL